MGHISVLLGSPRKGGNSETMAEEILAHAPAGSSIDRIVLSSLRLEGCRDCRRCWSGGTPCVIPDDMSKVYRSLGQADLIFFVTPLYWYSWSASIKAVWDRLLPYCTPSAPRSLQGKRAVLVASAGDDGTDCFDGLRFSMKKSCDLLGISVVGEFLEGELMGPEDAKRRPTLLQRLKDRGGALFHP